VLAEWEERQKMNKFGFATAFAGGLLAAVLGFAGPAHADIVTNPPTPAPHYHVDNQDNTNTTNGFVDQPF
jgi:hypothetical protein